LRAGGTAQPSARGLQSVILSCSNCLVFGSATGAVEWSDEPSVGHEQGKPGLRDERALARTFASLELSAISIPLAVQRLSTASP